MTAGTIADAVRHTMADLEAAESRVRTDYFSRWGCEPGLVYTREAALELIAKERSK